MFGKATAHSRCQTLCSSKVKSELKKIKCWKSRGGERALMLHSWRRQRCQSTEENQSIDVNHRKSLSGVIAFFIHRRTP